MKAKKSDLLVFQYNYKLDVEKMREAISYFLGEHDFRAFVTENKEKENCIRTITEAKIEEIGEKLKITFTGKEWRLKEQTCEHSGGRREWDEWRKLQRHIHYPV